MYICHGSHLPKMVLVLSSSVPVDLGITWKTISNLQGYEKAGVELSLIEATPLLNVSQLHPPDDEPVQDFAIQSLSCQGQQFESGIRYHCSSNRGS